MRRVLDVAALALVLAAFAGWAFAVLDQPKSSAYPAPPQPILEPCHPKTIIEYSPDKDYGPFRCRCEAQAWAAFASRDFTPNDADSWLHAWRARGGCCELEGP